MCWTGWARTCRHADLQSRWSNDNPDHARSAPHCAGPMWSSDGHNLLPSASANEIRDAYSGYYAYFGTWDIDERAHTVTHHVRASLRSAEVDSDYVRPYELSGEQLLLRYPVSAPDGERGRACSCGGEPSASSARSRSSRIHLYQDCGKSRIRVQRAVGRKMPRPEDERRLTFIPRQTRECHGRFTLSSSLSREGKVGRRDVGYQGAVHQLAMDGECLRLHARLPKDSLPDQSKRAGGAATSRRRLRK